MATIHTTPTRFTFVLVCAVAWSAVLCSTLSAAPRENTPPVAVAQEEPETWVPKDGSLPVQLTAIDPDAAAGTDLLSFALYSNPSHGTLEQWDGTTGTAVYRPDAGYAGRDVFRFTVSDGLDQSEPAAVVLFVSRWVTTILLENADTGYVQLGADEEADDLYNRGLDLRSPPPSPESGGRVVLLLDEQESEKLARDIRHLDLPARWLLSVDPADGDVVGRWSQTSLPASGLRLWERDSEGLPIPGTLVDMAGQKSLVLAESRGSTRNYGIAPPLDFVLESVSPSVPEGGVAAARVRLSRKPMARVTATVTRSEGDSDITLVTAPTTIIFEPETWDSWQSFQIRAAEDGDLVDGTTGFLIHQSGGSDSVPDATLRAAEDDDDVVVTVVFGDGGTVAHPGTRIVDITQNPFSIQAVADVGFEFSHWEGQPDGCVADPSAASTSVTIVSGTTVRAYFTRADPIEHVLSLAEGWNLISLPVEPVDDGPDQVLDQLKGNEDYSRTENGHKQTSTGSVWGWSCSDGAYAVAETLQVGVGYWLYAVRSVDILIYGWVTPAQPVLLAAGWNLVGFPAEVQADAVEHASGPIWRWETGAGVGGRGTPGYTPVELLQPGLGYWLYRASKGE